MCDEPDADHACLPCRHLCLCADCAAERREEDGDGIWCPICFEVAESYDKVYF
jgi:hypothetical protein